MAKKFYITTTLPYVNSDPHIGFAMEIIRADTIARYHRLLGETVIFNTGTDEHGLKIFQKATEERKSPQKYCDEKVIKYLDLKKLLNLSFTNFIRTTDKFHILAAQEFWRRCFKNGDIYKAKYQIKYCVGCELEKTDSELADGRCPIHPNRQIEMINEENYFFCFSKYQKELLDLYQKRPDFVLPKFRLEEISNFVRAGLKDFSISRLKEKMPWGIPVPGDPEQVMYVWFDALINYISTLGWPKNEKKFQEFWPGIQIAGKDNLRQQSAMWQAMLISAGLPPSKQIYIEGFINLGGQKMSKSLGNIIDPFQLVKKCGTEAVRYYLLKEIPAYSDGDFSLQRFKEVYNADLANGLGNLVSRTVSLAEKYFNGKVPSSVKKPEKQSTVPLIKIEIATWKKYDRALKEYKFNEALEAVWRFIEAGDKYVNQEKPWELAKNKDKKLNQVVYNLLESLHQIAWLIYPFMPETARKVAKQLSAKKLLVKNPLSKDSWIPLKPGTNINLGKPLFPRIQ